MKIVGCFLEHDGKFLILYRNSHKPDGDTWGLPGGKVEPGETDTSAAIREVYEETGYAASGNELAHLGDYAFTSSWGEPYVFGTYSIRLQGPHMVIQESSAHGAHRWVTAQECYGMDNLISGFHELLELTGYVALRSDDIYR